MLIHLSKECVIEIKIILYLFNQTPVQCQLNKGLICHELHEKTFKKCNEFLETQNELNKKIIIILKAL